MQRLRHIQQLGLTSLVYPGATHHRFSHSLGVFALARAMTERLCRHGAEYITQSESERVQLAALLHDIGHGPYSHMFERAQLNEPPVGEKWHEVWGKLLLAHPEIEDIFATCGRTDDWQFLQKPAGKALAFLQAILAGTFDVDRMDYLHRDQVMTGSSQGRFDWPWLMDNVEWDQQAACMVLNTRAIHAAEGYLLARSHLYQTVYLHRTVRGAEGILVLALRLFAQHCRAGTLDQVMDVPPDFPLRRWYEQPQQHPDAALLLQLDDIQMRLLMDKMQHSGDALLRRAAGLRYRQLCHCYEPVGTEKHRVEQWLSALVSEDLSHGAVPIKVLPAPWQEVSFERCTFTPYDPKQPILVRQAAVTPPSAQTLKSMQADNHSQHAELSTISPIAQALSQPIVLLRLYSDNYVTLERLRQEAGV